MDTQSTDINTVHPAASLQVLIIGGLAIIGGTLLAAVVLPAWLPGLAGSVTGEAPTAFWYISRGTAIVAFVLLWASMALGLMITTRLARLWPGGPAAFDLHQYVSLLGLGFSLLHALILLGDHFINFNIFQILLPFTTTGYKPFWVGLGQLGFYAWAFVVGSFYVRKQLGNKTWRLVHFTSFAAFALALVHGILSGTDSSSLWAATMYWFAGGSTLVLLFYRILVTVGVKKAARTSASGVSA